METKIDYKKEYPKLYNPSPKEAEIVTAPAFQFLMIDGVGMDFGNPESQQAIQALFAVAYKIKFGIKKMRGIDYGVLPLEGLWWADDPDDFVKGNREKWRWTYMIRQPELVAAEIVQAAVQEVRKGQSNQALERLRCETFTEGESAQIMHIGPFSAEHPNIMKVHRRIEESGGRFDGQIQKHHEIYLSDFRKTAPERLKAVLRQPFVR